MLNFKYPCTAFFHRQSLDSFYKTRELPALQLSHRHCPLLTGCKKCQDKLKSFIIQDDIIAPARSEDMVDLYEYI